MVEWVYTGGLNSPGFGHASSSLATRTTLCDISSVGRASGCQSEGDEFETRMSLQIR